MTLDELVLHPWIMIGWGVKQEKQWRNLQLIKEKWRALIEESKIPSFGKKHQKKNDYYHPCPLIPTQRPLMIEDLVNIYKNKFAEIHEDQKRYTLLKWNGEYGAEAKFIVRDNFTGKQSLFTPGKCQDIFWFQSDLANDQVVSDWSDFGNESFDDLELIAF